MIVDIGLVYEHAWGCTHCHIPVAVGRSLDTLRDATLGPALPWRPMAIYLCDQQWWMRMCHDTATASRIISEG